jgi:uncharacterized GH25 family protein
LRISAVILAAATLAVSAFAHYTWIAPVDALEVGRTATVRISHGHKFPQGEEAINASQVDLFVLTPSGTRVKLAPSVSASAVSAAYAVKEAGLHRIAFVQDRGVTSRTPKGVRPGGRDKNPDATQSYRTLRTSVSYAATAKAPAAASKSVGLEFELAAEFVGGAWKLQLLNHGKPAPGVSVEAFIAGAAKATDAGKTGSDGRLTFAPPAGSKGPAMFSAETKSAPPQGAAYDSVNLSTSLYVTW